jgi:hypothetical protein
MKVFDADGSGDIDAYEYLIFRHAVTDYDEYNTVTAINCFRYYFLLQMYDFDSSGKIEYDEIKLMVQGMAESNDYVERVLLPVLRVPKNIEMDFTTSNWVPAAEAMYQEFQRCHLNVNTILTRKHPTIETTSDRKNFVVFNPSEFHVTEPFHGNDTMHTTCDWKGILFDEEDQFETILGRFIEVVQELVSPSGVRASTPNMHNWIKHKIAEIFSEVNGAMGAPTSDEENVAYRNFLDTLFEKALEALSRHTLNMVPLPCKIFGDLNGDLVTLLDLFYKHGFPGEQSQVGTGDIESCAYLFNGNFSDGNDYCLETVIILLALKVRYPGRVFINHGIQENKKMDQQTTFTSVDIPYLDKVLFSRRLTDYYVVIANVFTKIPYGALVGRKIFVSSSGIGSDQYYSWSIQDPAELSKSFVDMAQHDSKDYITNSVLFSSPIVDKPGWKADTYYPRCTATLQLATNQAKIESFCEDNNINVVIQSNYYPPAPATPTPEELRKGISNHGVMFNGRLFHVNSSRNNRCNSVTSSTVVPYKASILFVSRNEENQIEIRPKVLDYNENLNQYTKSTFNNAVGKAAADGQPAKKHKVPGAGGGVKSPPVAKKVVQGGAGQDD